MKSWATVRIRTRSSPPCQRMSPDSISSTISAIFERLIMIFLWYPAMFIVSTSVVTLRACLYAMPTRILSVGPGSKLIALLIASSAYSLSGALRTHASFSYVKSCQSGSSGGIGLVSRL